MSDDRWTTIESDPGVFSELVHLMGVKNVQFEEIYTLMEDSFVHFGPVYGLIFLFKYTGDTKESYNVVESVDGLYFANQTVADACATQAILSILLNKDQEVDIGDHLRTFKSNTMDLPAQLKGVAIGNDDVIRNSHNSFRRPDVLSVVDKFAKGTEDVYHFVSYIPYNGRLYELDGLQKGPIDHGEFDGNWIQKAIPVIQQRIAVYAQSEVGFNLMAVVKNLKSTYLDQLNILNEQKKAEENTMEVEGNMSFIDQQIEDLKEKIQYEDQKFESWKKENTRRRHNYIPFLFNLLKVLAEKDQLSPLVEKAKQKAKDRKKGSM